MKMKIQKAEKPQFKPIEVSLTLETIAEARLFYQILNDNNLRNLLGGRAGTAIRLGTTEHLTMVGDAIEDQGFEV